MKITFIQTSDPFRYYPMLQETSKTIRRYCQVNGFDYEQYVGIKRGHMLWQSTFNRAYLLKEMLDRGVEGWVFYLDADAFIIDMRFDLVTYLSDKERYGAIFAGHISERHDVNAGGFAVNLSHPAGKALVAEYHRRCEAAATDQYFRAISWESDVYNDQYLLYLLLKDWSWRFGFDDAYLIEQTNHSFVNNGPFISQLLRGLFPTFEDRYDAIRKRVAEIMMTAPPIHPYRTAGTWLPAIHPRLTTESGNQAGVGLFTTGRAGAFLRGPRMRLEPGRYVLRLFGRADSAVPASSVVASDGTLVLSALAEAPPGNLGVLAEHRFEITETLHDIEIQVDVGEDHHLCIHGLQVAEAPPSHGAPARRATAPVPAA